jgi:ubiquinone/menaquinone biosynthesis C-methylase UbiE
MAHLHGVRRGMRVLEVGPGNGRYTAASARAVGLEGEVVCIDIEPKMIERVKVRAEREGLINIDARVADVYSLPFADGHFNAAYMMTVIGEIPDTDQVFMEMHRVLAAGGTLAFSEIVMDPDFPLSSTLIKRGLRSGFQLQQFHGNFLNYTLVFVKQA